MAGFGGVASAEPMDLSRSDARWVLVRFEASPDDLPGQTDTVYTPAYPAWLESDEASGRVRVTIPSAIVEAHLFDGHQPVPGSFSDFTWTFDADTGEVLSAEVEGRLWHHLAWGVSVKAPVRVSMDTRRSAGFAPPRTLLGREYRSFCRQGDEGCTLVEPRAYDPHSGYVNAVGEIRARSGPFRVRSFSPLGEAIFSEVSGGALTRTAGGTSGWLSPVASPPPESPTDRGMPGDPAPYR